MCDEVNLRDFRNHKPLLTCCVKFMSTIAFNLRDNYLTIRILSRLNIELRKHELDQDTGNFHKLGTFTMALWLCRSRAPRFHLGPTSSTVSACPFSPSIP